jgi:hypothetical protein
MKAKRRFHIALIILVSIFFFSLSWAAGSGRTIVLEPTAEHPEAAGRFHIPTCKIAPI